MPDIPPDLQSALAARYDLKRVLGRGGMATVYLAGDLKHRRQVAIKVLRPDLAASLGAERFLQEIQIAARLTHPHILALHDSGEAAGFLFYVMPFIDGPSLRLRLESERRLELADALAIASPVAEALGYAHRMGVFHRDIKPENILFSEGHPIVADFGIAKAISTAGQTNLTRTGFPLGTPGYMSPEQAAGLTDLDERTDVYSLAVVVYEMLVGEVPGRWPTEEAVRSGRFLEAPAAHRSRLAQVGSVVEGGLVRGMAIRHDQRTVTPLTLIDELTGAVAPRRRFSDGEVREIVKRASEIEATNPTAGGAMTVGGIEALAAEVGIAPETVRQVARSVAADPSTPVPGAGADTANRPNFWLGAPTSLAFERVVEGELPEAEFPVLVEEIRRMTNHPGQVNQLGRSFTWNSMRGGGSTRNLEVSVSVRAGRTRITVREGLLPLVGGWYGGMLGGLGGGGLGPLIGILASNVGPIAAVVAVPLWMGGVFAMTRSAFYYSVRRRRRQLEALMDRVVALTQELTPGRPALRSGERRAIR